MSLFKLPILIRGAGDLASGVAFRLVQAGFPVMMTELAHPLVVRTTVSYGIAVLFNTVTVEGQIARLATIDQVPDMLAENVIPVLVDPDGEAIRALRPPIVIDARMAKVPLDTTINDAPLVVGLGPGYTAGLNCHAVVETNRGHWLGRVYWQGSAEPDTGIPGKINGKGGERILRAPNDGEVEQVEMIGTVVKEGTVLARVGGTPILAPFDGVLRGLIEETYVTAGLKIGDIDPRAKREHCFTMSDKSLAIGGGVVEAVLSAPQIRRQLQSGFITESAKAHP
jgi:xanthine dehydrogenase accessory factor